MAQQDGEQEQNGSGLDQLRDALLEHLGARAQKWADSAGDKVSGLTDRLTDAAENGGGLPGIGSRVLGGQSPVKAFVSQKAKDMKDSVVGKVKDKLPGGSGSGSKAGDSKVTSIVETLDVGLPVRTVYDHWSQFEDFSSFAKGVRSVSKGDETTSDWKAKVGPSSRSWKATVQEQVPDERIVWSSEGAKGSTRGAVSFHELAPNLTRIVLFVEYYPAGFFEKTGNLWRAPGRRMRLDLKHFGRFVTLGSDDEPEGWRGEIRDGEVVRSHEEGLEDDEDNDTENEDEDGTGGEDEYPEEEYDEDEEEGDDDEEYENDEDAQDDDED